MECGISRAHIDITGKCNSNCKHCHMSKYRNKQMSLKKILSLLDDLKDIGINKVALSGGEPFIRKDFFKILEKCPRDISILSNGSMITENLLKRLKEFEDRTSSVITLRISLDGIESHESMRSFPNQNTLNVIKKIREFGFVTVVNTTTSQYLKKDELLDMLHKLESIGVDQWNIDIPFNEGNFKKNKMKLDLDFLSSEFEKLIREHYGSKYNIRMDIVGLYSSERLKEKNVFSECDLNSHPCSYQFPSVTINPVGDIQLCPSLHFSFGKIKNIKNYRDSDKWKDFSSKNRLFPKGCALCRYIKICGGGCRANAFSFEGDLWGRDELSCYLMKLLESKILNIYKEDIQNQFKELICDFSIKDYRIEDSEEVVELFRKIYPNWSDKELAKIAYDPNDKRHVSTKLMMMNKKIIGQINVFRLRNKNFATVGYHVHPEYRRRGIATKLLEKVTIDAKNNGIKYLIIRVEKTNLPSILFAKKENFLKITKKISREKNLEYLEKPNQIIFMKKI